MNWITGSLVAFIATLIVCAGLLFALKPWRIKGMAKTFINVVLCIPLALTWIGLFVGPDQQSVWTTLTGPMSKTASIVPWLMVIGLFLLPSLVYLGVRATDSDPKAPPPMPRLTGAIELLSGTLLVFCMTLVGLNIVFGRNFDPTSLDQLGMVGLFLRGLGYAIAFILGLLITAVLLRGSSPQIQTLLNDVLHHRIKYLLAFLPFLALFIGFIIKLSTLAFST
ncbi:hypothetical protein IT087_01585 [Candidatus Uhrbacteria bacterium]|nr:hypothetical protein [Candidatus Uhrbacteria bacterium]